MTFDSSSRRKPLLPTGSSLDPTLHITPASSQNTSPLKTPWRQYIPSVIRSSSSREITPILRHNSILLLLITPVEVFHESCFSLEYDFYWSCVCNMLSQTYILSGLDCELYRLYVVNL